MSSPWFIILVPIITTIVVSFHPRWRHKVAWFEMVIPIAVSAGIIALFMWIGKRSLTSDEERWGGYVTSATHFEDWNERVSCRHPKYRTETYRDSNGNTRTRQVQDGYQHLYDVDYHPEHYVASTTDGGHRTIGGSHFSQLVDKFGNKKFVNLHRNYHTNDGDKYVTNWDGKEETFEPSASIHNYENRVQNSDSIFNYPDVNESDIEEYGLYGYPTLWKSYRHHSVLWSGHDSSEADKRLNYWNGKLGHKKQLVMYVLVFHNQPREAGELQEAYWKNGNKNEMVLCIGVDDDDHVTWSHVFSWTDEEMLKIEIRNLPINYSNKPLDLINVVDEMARLCDEKWVRKHFSDFNYINVRVPLWSTLTSLVVVLAISVLCNFIAVNNNLDALKGNNIDFNDIANRIRQKFNRRN